MMRPRANVGLEYGWERTVFTRLGSCQNYDALQFSYGLGVAVDYALVDYRAPGYLHQ